MANLFGSSFRHSQERSHLVRAQSRESAALTLGVERKRVVRAIDVMEQQGLIEVKAGDVRIHVHPLQVRRAFPRASSRPPAESSSTAKSRRSRAFNKCSR